MKNFTRFASYFADYVKAKQVGATEDLQVGGFEFIQAIRHSMLNCHIFEITTDVKRLLALTKTPKRNDMFNLPFDNIFIDVNFKNEEMKNLGIDIGYGEIIGVIVTEGNLLLDKQYQLMKKYRATSYKPVIDDEDVAVGRSLRITILSVTEGRVWFDVFNEECNVFDKYKDFNFKIDRVDSTDKHARKFIHLFVLNFLNFIYSPEVKIVSIERDEKRNAKRIAKNKVPIPERKIIKLTGDLKIYVDKLSKDKQTWSHSHRYWVRGHFRTLRDPEYWGEKAGTRIFIPPYIRGSGILVEKSYEVDKKDAT